MTQEKAMEDKYEYTHTSLIKSWYKKEDKDDCIGSGK